MKKEQEEEPWRERVRAIQRAAYRSAREQGASTVEAQRISMRARGEAVRNDPEARQANRLRSARYHAEHREANRLRSAHYNAEHSNERRAYMRRYRVEHPTYVQDYLEFIQGPRLDDLRARLVYVMDDVFHTDAQRRRFVHALVNRGYRHAWLTLRPASSLLR